MKRTSNIIVAAATLLASFSLLVNTASAANKNFHISSNIEAVIFVGNSIEPDHGMDAVVSTQCPLTGCSVDENSLRYISVEPDLFLANAKLTSVKINDVAQDITSPNGRNIYELPDANNYTVDITGVATVNYNINWSNPGYNDPGTQADVKIINGAARVVKVYDNATNMNDISASYPCVANGCVNNTTKEGHILFEKGNVIVFEFTPQYGYQLTSVNMNGMPLTPQENPNQYTLDTADATGNGHFSATFTKISDVVKTNSAAVTSGVLDLSNGAIDAGTGRLSVDDFAPSANQVTKFEQAASGYEIASYFDLNMQQVFYKGTNNDTDVWTNDLSQLAADANISLVLAEGINGNDVAIVHEKHDGTCELISGTYDSNTNTVSFASAGFSNYAIAYRIVNAPDTGASTSGASSVSDGIITAAIITLGSITAIFLVSRKFRGIK